MYRLVISPENPKGVQVPVKFYVNETKEIINLIKGEKIPEGFREISFEEGLEIEASKRAEKASKNRSVAYRLESDALFFKQQRGELPAGTWEAKVAEIKARYPK